jgi:peptidoglycan/LPS O-acetylase OafA/YrhL
MLNNTIRGGYSESINMLRFPLAILVVFVHGFGADIDVSELHASGLTGLAVYDYIRLFFSVVIARSAVPIFFIISGYLLFRKVEEYSKQVYVGKLKKRWHSLVIPYLSWNMLIVLWSLAFKLGGILLHGKPWSGFGDYFLQNGYLHMLWDSSVWDERTTSLGVETHNSGPVLLPFWYMRDLIMMVVLSPAFFWLIKRLRFFFILLLMAVYAFDIRVAWMSGTFTAAGLFFGCGAYFAIMKQDFTDVLWRWRYAIVPLAVILMAMQTYTGSAIGDSVSRMIHPWLVIFQSAALIIVASAMCRYQGLYRWNKKLLVPPSLSTPCTLSSLVM